jgi:hypothetical protein
MTLPILSYTPNNTNYTDIDIKESYNTKEFYKFVSEYTSSDCWAMTVNDEILWNFYENENEFKNNMRTNMIENPELAFSKMNKPEKIVIYMFGGKPWGIIFKWDNYSNKFNVNVSFGSEDIYKYITNPIPTNEYERELVYLQSLRLEGLIDNTIETMDQLLDFNEKLYNGFRRN